MKNSIKTMIFSFLIGVFFILPVSNAHEIPRTPDEVEFAGEIINLKNQETRQRIEKEIDSFLEAKYRTVARITGIYFPYIEESLKNNNLPDDLKFISIVESELDPKAISPPPDKAAGLWQFMPATGKRFNLKIHPDKCLDERYDWKKSTNAAISYLKDLYKQFGNWQLAIASYNRGENNIQADKKRNGHDNYWGFYNNNENSRFIPRVIAAKIVFSNIEKYFGISVDEIYQPTKTEKTKIKLKKITSLEEIAQSKKIFSYQFKFLNLHLRCSTLPIGEEYEIYILKNENPLLD